MQNPIFIFSYYNYPARMRMREGVIKQSLSAIVTKIAISRVLGICACCNYHGLVDIGEKLVSVCFELLNMAH